MNSPVVITGLGVVSPIGIGVEPFWQSLMAGKSGVRVIDDFANTRMPFRIAAPVLNFEGKDFIQPRKAIKIMCQPIQFGCAAAAMAAEMAGLDKCELDPDRQGTVFGTETFVADPHETASVFRKCIENKSYQHDRWGEHAMREIQPLWMLKYLPNMVASHISIARDARGPSNSICQGESSGLLALIEAANLIMRGAADVVVTGATGSQMAITAVLHRGIEKLSTNIDQPENASRPFDSKRDGIVVGEGAAALVLESLEHAEKRGANPLARIAGWNQSYCQLKDPEFSAAIKNSFNGSLSLSQKKPGDIAFINAHGNGSIEGDRWEAQAIHHVFGQTPVVANKANFGSLGPGSSSVEIVSSVCSLIHKTAPPNRNFQENDPDCPVTLSPTAVNLNSANMIKLSYSTTGQIASLVLDQDF